MAKEIEEMTAVELENLIERASKAKKDIEMESVDKALEAVLTLLEKRKVEFGKVYNRYITRGKVTRAYVHELNGKDYTIRSQGMLSEDVKKAARSDDSFAKFKLTKDSKDKEYRDAFKAVFPDAYEEDTAEAAE